MSSDSLSGLIFFVIIFTLEYFFPFFPYRQSRSKHTFSNLMIAMINSAIIFVLLGGMEQLFGRFGKDSFGLLNLGNLPFVLRICLAILIFDLWMYWWHRINHEIYFFWRFHRVHHTDPAMDSTTALRFHPIEIIFSYLLNVIILILAGISISDLVIYKAVMFPVILLHHSNLTLPKKWNDVLNLVFVMPSMHRVHHSEIREETDSNYGSIFSFWDRLFASYRERKDIKSIVYGIGTFKKPKWQNIKGMIIIPFKS